nr:phosphonoacetate hydrolase [Afipia sp.]
MKTNGKPIVVNGRNYNPPTRPTVVICLDGSEPGYIEKAIEAGVAPTFARFMKDGAHVHANSVI